MKFVLYSKRPSKTAISFLLATSEGLRNVPDVRSHYGETSVFAGYKRRV